VSFLIDPLLREYGARNPLEQEDPKEGRTLIGYGQPPTIVVDTPTAATCPPTTIVCEHP
jgi:hypothetical protein